MMGIRENLVINFENLFVSNTENLATNSENLAIAVSLTAENRTPNSEKLTLVSLVSWWGGGF